MKKRRRVLSRVLAAAMTLMLCIPMPVMGSSDTGSNTFDISEGPITVSPGQVAYGNQLTQAISDGDAIVIIGTSSVNGVLVEGVEASITLRDADINLSSGCAFKLDSGADVTLILEGANALKSGEYKAGLEVKTGNVLTIRGDGSLKANGTRGGSGIGSSATRYNYVGGNCGEVTIEGGTVIAIGSSGGAGIGGGLGAPGFNAYGGSTGGIGGVVTIKEGTVTATGAVGIGGGSGGDNSSGVGSGPAGGNGGFITIEGGTVTATGIIGIGGGPGGRGANGLAYGYGGNGGEGGVIAISGGTVCAAGTIGIGGGIGGSGGRNASGPAPDGSVGNACSFTRGSTGQLMMANFSAGKSGGTAVEAFDKLSGDSVASFAPADTYTSIAFTVPRGTLQLETADILQQHGAATPSTDFAVTKTGLTVFNTVADASPRTVSVSALTDGTITADRTTACGGQMVNLTITPVSDKQLQAGTLKYTVGAVDTFITGTSFTMPDADVSISAAFEALPNLAMAPIADQTLSGLETGYSAGTQSGKTITLTNAGLDDLVNLAVEVSGTDFTVTQPAITTLTKGADTTFVIQALDGLASGTYSAIVTVSADGLTPVTFNVTQKVSNPRLKSLDLGAGTLAPAFNGDTLAYTAHVDTGISGITVIPAAAETGTTIKVNGVTVASGEASQSITLSKGDNTLTIGATTQAGATRSYTIIVNRGILPLALTTASLPTAITGEQYTVALGAQGGTEPYTWSVTGLLAGLTLDTQTGIISGTASDTGSSSVTIAVTDSKGATDTKSLTLTVCQTFSIDLAGLSVGPGTLNTAFDKNTVSYVYSDTTANRISITANTADPAATLTINGQPAISGVVESVTLEQGGNLIPVVVTAPGGNSQKAYVISVNGTVSNADLGSMTVEGQSLTPVFFKAQKGYTLAVGNAVNTLRITAATDDPKALLIVDGSVVKNGVGKEMDIAPGSTAIEVMVVAQDASTQTYTLTVTRELSLTIGTTSLPLGIMDAPYNAVLAAQGGTAPYTWSATGLPDGLSLDENTGIITGIPGEEGQHALHIKVTDANGGEAEKSLTLKLNIGCGNGGYLITPDANVAYTSGLTADGIPTMTVNTGVSGFKYFSVTVEKVTGHSGNEVAVFVQIRSGQQVGINATEADFDTLNRAKAGFNVKPGDIIKMYIVNDLSNSATDVPEIL